MSTADPTEIDITCSYDGGDISKNIICGNIYNDIGWITGPKFSLKTIDDKDKINIKPDYKFNISMRPVTLDGESYSYKNYIPVSPSKNDLSNDQRPGNYNSNMIRLCNQSVYNIQKKPVNFSHKGLVSDAVKKILKENYGYDDAIIEQTKGEQTLRFGNVFPPQAIDSIGHRLVSPQNPTSLYALFVTQDNGNEKPVFKTYENLLKQNPVAVLEQRTNHSGLSLQQLRDSIIRFRTDSTSFSPYRPKPESVVYNPATGKSAKVGDPNQSIGYHPYGPLYNDNNSEAKLYRNKYPHNDRKNTDIEKTIPKQIDYFNRLAQTKSELEIPFNPTIKVGSVIELKRSKKISDLTGGEEPTINGKVLVTSVNVIIKPRGQSPRTTMVLKVITPSHKEA